MGGDLGGGLVKKKSSEERGAAGVLLADISRRTLPGAFPVSSPPSPPATAFLVRKDPQTRSHQGYCSCKICGDQVLLNQRQSG